jgi:hypothetical protein
MSEAELKKRHPYRSVQFRVGRRGPPIDGRVVKHVSAALGALASGVVACAAGLWPIAVVIFYGAFTTWLLWVVPYAVYLACGGRWNWRSTHRYVAALLVWMLAIEAAVGAAWWVEGRPMEAKRRALDALVRTTAHATRRYRADHGHYPDTLSALVPRYLPRIPVAEPPTCPIEYGVWQGVPTLWIPGRDPMFDSCIHRRGYGINLSTGRLLPR